MHVRTLVIAALVGVSATLAACSSDNTLGLAVAGGTNTDTLSNARIRVVNATATSLDVATAGTVGTGNAAIGFGAASTCLSTSSTRPNVAVRVAGSSTVLPGLATAYQSGVAYTVIAYPGTGGATQIATISDAFTPISGEVGLRVFNGGAAGTSYDVYVTAPGASLATTPPSFGAVTTGTATNFLGLSTTSPQQVRITTTGSKAVLLDLGNLALAAGQNATLVVAPPASGSTAPRAFFAAGC